MSRYDKRRWFSRQRFSEPYWYECVRILYENGSVQARCLPDDYQEVERDGYIERCDAVTPTYQITDIGRSALEGYRSQKIDSTTLHVSGIVTFTAGVIAALATILPKFIKLHIISGVSSIGWVTIISGVFLLIVGSVIQYQVAKMVK